MVTIAVDFDGTLVEHKYSEIGKPVHLAFETLKEWQATGVKLILWTCRSGNELEQAVMFCRKQGIEFYGINQNPDQIEWSASNKVYANMYIDDAALGCPLVYPFPKARPYVDWKIVRQLIEKNPK